MKIKLDEERSRKLIEMALPELIRLAKERKANEDKADSRHLQNNL